MSSGSTILGAAERSGRLNSESDADAAFGWLDRAYAAGDVHLIFLTVDVKWGRYRTDPRFGDLLARCGFTTIGTRAGKAIAR